MPMEDTLCRKSMTADLLMCLMARISCAALLQRLLLQVSTKSTSQLPSLQQHGLRKVEHCLLVMQHLIRSILMPTSFMQQSRLLKSCFMTMPSVLKTTSSPSLVRLQQMPKRMHSLTVAELESLLVSSQQTVVVRLQQHLLQPSSPMTLSIWYMVLRDLIVRTHLSS